MRRSEPRVRAALLAALGLVAIGAARPARAGTVQTRPLPRSGCAADCDRSGAVTVDELVQAVTIGLAEQSVARCAAADGDGNHAISVDEIIAGVNAALAGCPDAATDPGAAAWQPVPREQVVSRCGLDPDLLDAADPLVNRRYAVIRYGQLCHVYYPDGSDPRGEVFSTTKTLGGLTTGIAAYETRDLPQSGPKTGPLSDDDRVDHWLGEFPFNPDARIAHVLAMLAHNVDLSFGQRTYSYDITGTVQINYLSRVITAAIGQDSARLGATVEEFAQRFLFGPLGMTDSLWTGGNAEKIFGFSWQSTVLDMARVGLLMLHDGVWAGARMLDEAWIYKMTHPSFEDANTGYGYLTWVNSASNYTRGLVAGPKLQEPFDDCAPLALNREYPHGLSESPDCNYEAPLSCEQPLDVGMWFAAGLGGQYIVGHRGLDLVLVVKDSPPGPGPLWAAVRPALVALDPEYHGDEAAFCAAYAAGAYAPDFRGGYPAP